MTPREMINIIQAYEQGEEIEWRLKRDSDWAVLPVVENFESGCEQFDFNNYDYRIKKKKWRAEAGSSYFCISTSFDVMGVVDGYDHFDNQRHECGNYFQTEDQATQARELLKQALTNFHASL